MAEVEVDEPNLENTGRTPAELELSEEVALRPRFTLEELALKSRRLQDAETGFDASGTRGRHIGNKKQQGWWWTVAAQTSTSWRKRAALMR